MSYQLVFVTSRELDNSKTEPYLIDFLILVIPLMEHGLQLTKV